MFFEGSLRITLFSKYKGKAHVERNMFMTRRQKCSEDFFRLIGIITVNSSIHGLFNE